MATIHNVCLFLPYTVNFEEVVATPERRRSPPILPSRKSSTYDLPRTASLFAGPTPPITPSTAAHEEFFAQCGPPSLGTHFHKPHDPRTLVRSDAGVSEWERSTSYKQPRSRAGPLPSASILDYAKVHEKLSQERLKHGNTNKPESKVSLPTTKASRNSSKERNFESKSWTIEPAIQCNGGLNNAVRAATEGEQAENIWVGTLGFPTDALPDSMKESIQQKLENEYEALAVYVSDKDLDGHYAHYCKTILWPVFHYQIPDHPKSKAYADHSWEFYRNVNQAFADKVVASYKRGDTIWVHDYHLLLVPAMIRKKLPEAQIGFFLHTAFPSSEVFRCLATRKDLLEGMLGANLVAFQSDEYAQHFLQTCSRLLTVEATNEGVQLEDHFVNVTSEPIGIDPEATNEARQDPEVQEWIEVIQEKYKGKKLIVARDKLDHVRGVRQKLLAYELFLNKYPEWRDKVVMIQVATSTNEQSELLTTVSDICTRIDSVHSTLAHQPLVFLKQDIAFSQYLALLTVADVLVITSLREGMNLTAHEYVVCQDGTGSDKKYGPLILSEFTGSAAVFGKHPININPWDYQQQAEAFRNALQMGDEEKARRHEALSELVHLHTGSSWAVRLNKSLVRVHGEHHQRDSMSIPRLSLSALAEKYKGSQMRIFIIDYEGTLAPHSTSTGIVLSSPQRVLDCMSELLNDSRNVVYIMSGRRPEELERIFRTVPQIGLIAENGCFLREFSASMADWTTFADLDAMEKWKKEVKGTLCYYQERLEGSTIDERLCSILFRYDKVEDQEAAVRQAGEAADHINDACSKLRVHAIPIPKAVLIEPVDFSKASAAAHIFEELCKNNVQGMGKTAPDFLMVAGDDREDEVIFRWANNLQKEAVIQNVCTVSMGKRNTEAQATLTQGTTGLLTALQKLVKVSQDEIEPEYFSCKRPSL